MEEPPPAEAGGEGPATTSSGEKQKGSVKWFNATKGFGFITPESGGEDLFVHQSNILASGFRSLREGEPVEFHVEAGSDGRCKAVEVTGPSGAPPQGAPPRSGYRAGGFAQPAAGRAAAPPMGGRPGRGRAGRSGFYGYPAIPPFYVGYYFPQGEQWAGEYDPSGGRGRGRGRGMGGRSGFLLPPGMPPGMQPMQPPAEPSGLQVVVHNLPWTCTWQQLKDLFKEWRVERADIVMDQWGRSRGFGTVRLATQDDAKAACTKLNNTLVEGRTISVRIDRFA